MEFTKNQRWRYATKKFDPAQKVSPENLKTIREAVQLSASSYGLQPYKVIEIENAQLRTELQPLSWGQTQITDASNLFVFCNYLQVADKDVQDYIELKAKTNGLDIDQLAGYGDFVKQKISEKPPEDMQSWTAKQTYIALANAMSACAALEIDCTPMEGFDNEAYNTKLGLTKLGLNACVVLAIGYRHAEDAAQHGKKVRKPISGIFNSMT